MGADFWDILVFLDQASAKTEKRTSADAG